jgi:hypothetical protein
VTEEARPNRLEEFHRRDTETELDKHSVCLFLSDLCVSVVKF